MNKFFSSLLPLFLLPLISLGQPINNPNVTAGNSNVIIDWNEVGMIGTCSGNGLVLHKGDPVPFDYAAPLFSNFALEVGFRYPIFFDKQSNVSLAAEAPLQLGFVNSSGPSVNFPKYSNSIWIAAPAMITMNEGLGASYDNSDKKFGAYIGIGLAYNKALIREKYYPFYYQTPAQESLPFRYVGYFTANAMTGIRWRNRNGIVRNLGVEGNYGIYTEWMIGISFGTVLGM